MSLLTVFKPNRVRQLLVADFKSIQRDPTLLFALLLSIATSVGIAWFRPQINQAAFNAFGVSDIIRYTLPMLLTLPAFLIGWVIGFLLLEDRDEHTLLALDITPVGKGGYMLYRIGIAMGLTFAVTALSFALLSPETALPLMLILSFIASLEGACAAFVLPAVARNKVEGLAVTKLTNIFAVAALLALIPSPWRYLGALIPTFWFGEALQLSRTLYLPLPIILVIALALHLLAAWGLFRLVLAKVG